MAEPDRILDALGDANRRAILGILSENPSTVQVIADQLPISRPAVSRHLRLLKEASLVEAVEQGTQRMYSVRAEGVAAAHEYTKNLWEHAVARFTIAAENTVSDS